MEITKPKFTLSYILNHAFESTRGAKWPIWSVALVMFLITAIIRYLANVLFGTQPTTLNYWINYVILSILTTAVTAPFVAGLYMVAIKRVREENISAKTGFQYFNFYIPVAITLIIIDIVSGTPLMIVNWPTIARALGHSLATANLLAMLLAVLVYTFWFIATPLVIDKNKSVVDALQSSVRLTSPVWLKIFGLILIIYFFIFVTLLPFAIGLLLHNEIVALLGAIIFVVAAIWLLPFLFMLPGVVYWLLVDKP